MKKGKKKQGENSPTPKIGDMEDAHDSTYRDTFGYTVLDVGGTEMRIDAALASLAPPGSVLGMALASPAPADGSLRFVDQHHEHLGRAIDCLRHGIDALDCMPPYDAHIVRSLLSPTPPFLSSPSAMGDDGDRDRPSPADRDSVVRLAVGSLHMSVSRATLRSDRYARSRPSVLAQMFDPERHLWLPARAPDGRAVVVQNGAHFARLVDCLRHGLDLLPLMDLYDVWGVRALGRYYGLDAVAHAADADMMRRESLLRPDHKRRTSWFYTRATLPAHVPYEYDPSNLREEDWVRCVRIDHHAGHSIERIAAAGVGSALPGSPTTAVALYDMDHWGMASREYGKEYAYWTRVDPHDQRAHSHAIRRKKDYYRTLWYVEPVADCPAHVLIAPAAGGERQSVAVGAPLLVVLRICDVSADPPTMIDVGPVIVTDRAVPSLAGVADAYRTLGGRCPTDHWRDISCVRGNDYKKKVRAAVLGQEAEHGLCVLVLSADNPLDPDEILDMREEFRFYR